MKGRFKDPVVLQSMMLDVSAALQYMQNLEEVDSNASQGMNLLQRPEQEGKKKALVRSIHDSILSPLRHSHLPFLMTDDIDSFSYVYLLFVPHSLFVSANSFSWNFYSKDFRSMSHRDTCKSTFVPRLLIIAKLLS